MQDIEHVNTYMNIHGWSQTTDSKFDTWVNNKGKIKQYVNTWQINKKTIKVE
jgi:hypothetical protein